MSGNISELSQHDCFAAAKQHTESWRQKEDLKSQLFHNDKLIQEKGKLHGEYWPIPGRSVRSNLREEIKDLKDRNIEVKSNLAKVDKELEESHATLLKCLKSGLMKP